MGSSKRRNSRKKNRQVKPPAITGELLDICDCLEVAMAHAYAAVAALRGQGADSDDNIGIVVQRSVGDAIDRQLEEALKGIVRRIQGSKP